MPPIERKSKSALQAGVVAALVLAAAVIAASFAADGWARARILESQGKGWKKSTEAKVLNAVSRYGDWPELMLVGAAGLFIAHRARSRDWKRILIAAMTASTLAGILANTSRLTTGRTRPRESPKIEQGWYGPFHDGQSTIGNSKYNSFPSGHTATAFGFAAVILFARPLVGILAMLAAAAIAWARMALGAHHLSDVVVATVLAVAIAWFIWRTAVRDGDRIAQWALARLRRTPS